MTATTSEEVNAMASYNIKHIEYLRQKANLTYEQAVALLDRNDGDLAKALVELEKSGALGGTPAQPVQSTYSEPQDERRARSFWDNVVDLFIKGLRIRLVIEKGNELIARLPVIYLLAAMFMAPHLALLSVVLMFLTGCRVHIERSSNPEGDRKIRDYARGAERTVRNTVNSAQEDRQRRAPYNAPAADQGKPKDDDDDDFGSFTVE